jgi:hypothetical protein
LVHFDPPSISPLTLDRFSPYQADPARYGIEVLGPPPHYRNLYDLDDATRAELAWTFEFTLPDRPRPGDDAAPLIERILAWRQHASANRMALRYRCGPSFMVIEDDRSTFGRRRFTLDATEARVYLACEAGHDVGRIMRDLDAEHASGLSATAVRCLLEDFVAEGLAYEEGGRFLSLALPRRPERSARPVVALRNSAMGDTAMADGEHGASTPS